ncbi:MAG: glutamate 5-kinase [Actinobacteria bacterium]|nr:glutamate 5-kinase [Actinomycetota bacterium]
MNVSDARARFGRPIKRVVVKVGTTSITKLNGDPDRSRMQTIASQLGAQVQAGVDVVLVSSGAIAAGMSPLGFDKRPTDMPSLQAAAAVGQRRLMDLWATFIEPSGPLVSQILLTRFDIVQRKHYLNARNTMQKLLELGCIPIVNENDSVATEEIRYGDNDLLAALVANIVSADLLIVLSDVDGLYASHLAGEKPEVIERVDRIDESTMTLAKGSSGLGSGGMASKLEAARIATRSGVAVVIAPSRQADVIGDLVEGKGIGTYFPASSKRIPARKLWIAYAPEARGKIFVDNGAVDALVTEIRVCSQLVLTRSKGPSMQATRFS